MRIRFFLASLVLLGLWGYFVTAQEIDLTTLEIINPDNAHQLVELAYWEGVNGRTAANFSPDGSLLAIALGDGTVQLVDTTTLTVEGTLQGADTDTATQIRFNTDGNQLLLTSLQGQHILWDLVSSEQLAFQSPDKFTQPSDNLEIYYRHWGNEAVVYDMQTDDEIGIFTPADLQPRPKFDEDGELLLTSDDRQAALLWNIETQQMLYRFDVGDLELQGMGFTPEGYIWISGSKWNFDETTYQGALKFFDKENGDEIESFEIQDQFVYRIYFSPDLEIAAMAGQRGNALVDNIWIYDLKRNEEIGEIAATGGGKAAFNLDSSLLIAGSGTVARLSIYDLTEIELLARLETPNTGLFEAPILSPDGRMFVTTGASIRLWGVPSSQE